MASINRGDNTGAFGNDFLRIYLNNPNGLLVTRALLQINGDLEKEYYDPIFPLRVNFTGAETEMLHQVNTCKLALWDEYGRRRTADGKFTFFVKENRINSPDAPMSDGEEIYPEENSVTFDLTDAEFACQFVINATPSKVSELVLDIPIMLPENIKAGENIYIEQEGNDVIINAEAEIETSYNNLLDKPSINGQVLIGDIHIDTSADQVQADWKERNQYSKAYIKNKPTLAAIAISGNYNDLVGAPYIPVKVSDLNNDLEFITKEAFESDYYTKEEVDTLVEQMVDLTEVNERIDGVIEQEASDKEELLELLDDRVDLRTFNTTVSDLQRRDAGFADSINLLDGQVEILNAEMEYTVKDEALIPIVEKLGTCVTASELNIRLSGYATQEALNNGLNSKANKTAIKDGILTIQKNGTTIGTFSANSTNDSNINLSIPVRTSDLANDSDFLTAEDININNYVTKAVYNSGMNSKLDKTALGQGILTIKVNRETIGSFNANATDNKTVSISVPVNVSDLEQDVPYVKDTDLEEILTDISNLKGTTLSQGNRITTLETNIAKKVDKKANFSLVSDVEIERLAGVTNYDDTEITEDIAELSDAISTINTTLSNKVDKVAGKGLSTNDFSNDYKNILIADAETVQSLSTDMEEVKGDIISISNELDDINTDFNNLNTSLMNKINNETNARIAGDNALQEQIQALEAKGKVVDILATDGELSGYAQTHTLREDDVVCVLCDHEHFDTVTYYRWDCAYTHTTQNEYRAGARIKIAQSSENIFFKTTEGGLSGETAPAWVDGEGKQLETVTDGTITWTACPKPTTYDFYYIGSEGSYYTKSEADTRFISSSVEINGYPITGNIDLTYADVNALPADTVIGNGTITVQKQDLHDPNPETNRTTIKTFTLNQTENLAIPIPIPTDLSDLDNSTNFINKDILLDEYLGRDIPDNTLIQDEIDDLYDKVRTLEGDLPDVALDGKYSSLIGLPQIISDLRKNNKEAYNINPDYNTYVDDRFINDLATRSGFVTDVVIAETFARKTDIPEYVSQLENDRGYITLSAVGRGTLSIWLADEKIGEFNANAKDNNRIVVPVDTELSETSIYPVQNALITAELNRKPYDTEVVHITGDETIEGTKTIEYLITSTQAISDASTKAASTAFVNNYYNNKDTDIVHKSKNNETISGSKNFTGAVQLSEAYCTNPAVSDYNGNKVVSNTWVKSQGYALDADVVHDGGNETINGNKTFAETVTFNGITNLLGTITHVTTPDGSIQDAVANVAYVAQAIAESGGASEEVIQQMQQAIANLQTAVGTLTNSINALNTTIGGIQSDIGSLTSDLGTVQSTLNTATGNITSLTTRVTALETNPIYLNDILVGPRPV